ncbi:hypothetical protein [Arthrobacter sp. HLT1-21]
MITAAELEDLAANHEGVAEIYPVNPLTGILTDLTANLSKAQSPDRISITTQNGKVQVKARISVFNDAQSPALLRGLATAIKQAVLTTAAAETTCNVLLEIAGTRRADTAKEPPP